MHATTMETAAPAAEVTTPPWRTIRNPMIGDEVTFLRTARETGANTSWHA